MSSPAGGGRSRLFYGWILVAALGVTEMVSYGILSYAFPVFIVPMGNELGWSKTAVTGAFSLAMLVAGAAAIPIGGWVDRYGARGVMTAGSVLGVAVLLGWSRTTSLAGFYALSAGMGLAMAAVLYEPAFAVIANWFVRLRGEALTVLTFMGGFASVIFVPLTTWLVVAYGWRTALVWLAAIFALLTIPPHALLLRRRPEDLGLTPDGAPEALAGSPAAFERRVPAREAVRSPSFRWLCVAFALSALATTAVSVHLIPLLLERGFPATFAGAAMGMMGVMALPGRLFFVPLGSRWPRGPVTASIFLCQALGIGILLTTSDRWGVWTFVALFGAGFGAITPARAALLAELYGRAGYAGISGVLATLLAAARAAAPLGASLLYAAGGAYDAVLWTLLGISLASGAAVVLAGDAAPESTTLAPKARA